MPLLSKSRHRVRLSLIWESPRVSSNGSWCYTYSSGDTVTIDGTGFTGASAVTFGGVLATNVKLVNPTTITATVPTHAPGHVDVAVTNSIGTGFGSGLFKYVRLVYRPLP